jgi:hypothetical protein
VGLCGKLLLGGARRVRAYCGLVCGLVLGCGLVLLMGGAGPEGVLRAGGRRGVRAERGVMGCGLVLLVGGAGPEGVLRA